MRKRVEREESFEMVNDAGTKKSKDLSSNEENRQFTVKFFEPKKAWLTTNQRWFDKNLAPIEYN